MPGTEPPDEANLNSEAVRIGSYRLIERLGSGGMSSVLRAVHIDTGHEVAVKVLPRYLAKNPTLLQRFLREANSAEALEHPNIVAIFDRGFDQGRHYLVLEYVPGGDLHERVQRDGPLPVDEAVRIIKQVAEGLRYAATRGLIHRDIKPANLLLGPDGQAKITDLGLALQVADDDERVTRDGTTVGTVDYMAPEQARDSRATSIRSDIYSLGCTLYFFVTGSPPFPGGDVVEKLRRQFTERAPDVRLLRPEIPAAVARLIRRMMAKRPDDRFADYDALIAALDSALGLPTAPAGAVADALIDDEQPGGSEPSAPELAYALIDDAGPPAASGVSFALIDEEDAADRPAGPGEPPQGARGEGPLPDLTGVRLADLAPLDEDERPPRRPGPGSGSSLSTSPTDARPVAVAGPLTRPPSHPAFDSAEMEPPPVAPARDESVQRWIVGGVLVGLALVVLIACVSWIKAWLSNGQAPQEPNTLVDEGEQLPAEAFVASIPRPVRPVPPSPRPRPLEPAPRPSRPAEIEPAPTPSAPSAPPLTAENYPEPALPAEAEFLPSWAQAPIPNQVPGPFVTVERVLDARSGRDHVSILGQAFDRIGGTVELADEGPYFEDEFRIAGKDRVIRARPGLRPIIKVEPPSSQYFKELPAVIVLDGARLVLDGVDLVVNVQQLPLTQSALFQCRGGELIVHNCSITVINPAHRPFALVRTTGSAPIGGPVPGGGTPVPAAGSAARPTRVRLERTLVRGEDLTAFDLGAAATEVVASRSVLMSTGGPLIAVAKGPVAGAGADSITARRIALVRSLLAAPGPILNLAGPSAGGGPPGAIVRALGSTFARIKAAGGDRAACVAVQGEGAGGPPEDLDWLGDANTFAGWPVWLAGANGPGNRVADLAAVRSAWIGSDPNSKELPRVWPDPAAVPWLGPIDLRDRQLAPEQLATLARVAAPEPNLAPKTVAAFGRLGVGGGDVPPGSPSGDALLELSFDAQDPTWKGDLGAFVLSQIRTRLQAPRRGQDPRPGAGAPSPPRPGAPSSPLKAVHVVVRGAGLHAMTPIGLPEGTSLTVEVQHPPGPARPGTAPLMWRPVPGSSAEALIAVRGADLTLTHVRLWRDAGSGPRHLVRVEDGQLRLTQCWLRTAPGSEPGGRALIAFRSASAPGPNGPAAKPAPAPLPVCRLADCLILAAGDALAAELERGVVALEGCAIASGGEALVLTPLATRADRLEADLWLDRCTIVAAQSFVRLGAWSGPASGPDRPWLVSSQHTALIAAFGRSRPSVLLRVDPDAMARGVLCWQAAGDAIDVIHFTGTDQAPPPTDSRPDLRHQWVELWGPNHMENLTGPSLGSPKPSVRLQNESVRPGQLDPNDLALNPKYHPGRHSLNVGADLGRVLAP